MAEAECKPVRNPRIGSRLSKILQDLQSQQAASAQRSVAQPISVQEIVVVVMGATGAGKSTFIKRATSDEAVVVGDGLHSVTQEVRSFKCQHGSKQFSIVDTPGFNDTNRSDREILQELADWLLGSYRDGQKISGIIYLHRISAPRMEGSSMRSLRMFRKLCGEEFMENVVLGTTFWDAVGEEAGAAREKELLETEGFFKEMIDRGCDTVRISDSREECLGLLSRFATKRPSVMRIQQELFEGKPLEETGAASAISQELADLQRQNNANFADARTKCQRDLTRFELEKAFSLQLERRAHITQMEELASQQEALRDEMKQQEAETEQTLAKVGRAITRQNHGYQMELDQLNDQLRALRSCASSH